MMETARTSETSVDIDLTTRQYIPEDSKLRLVPFVPVGYFYSYVTGDGVCKYYISTKKSKHGLISFKIFYI
jgi:hypothetical protein